MLALCNNNGCEVQKYLIKIDKQAEKPITEAPLIPV